MTGEGQHRRRHRGIRLAAAAVAALLALGAALPAGADEPAPAGQRIETTELPSPLVDTASPGGGLARGRTVPKVHVLLPAGYDQHPERRYPVLWLLHGANLGTDSWLPGVTELLAGLEAVVVMPDGGRFGMYVDWWNGGRRGGPAWATYHLGVVRDWVEERYRIRPERRWHAIAGISMGGQGALRYAAVLPGYFGSVVALSPAFPDMRALEAQGGIGLLRLAGATYGVAYEDVYGPAAGGYARGTTPMALAANYEHTRVYVTGGNGVQCPQDPPQPNLPLDAVTEAFIGAQVPRFAHRVRVAGADVTARVTCGSHTQGVWDRAVPAARRWGLFRPVPEDPDTWTYRTIATSGEVWGLAYRFAQPPAEVVELARDGHWLSATGTGRLALRGPPGCELDLDLPARAHLPAACH